MRSSEERRWREGNDRGLGYAVGQAGQSPAEAAEEEGWAIVRRQRADDDILVARKGDGGLVAIGDANGPWAVDLAGSGEADAPAYDDLAEQWRERNDAGYGYPAGQEEQTPAEAAKWEGWAVLFDAITDDDVLIARKGDGGLVGIGDANGPWAVDLDLHDQDAAGGLLAAMGKNDWGLVLFVARRKLGLTQAEAAEEIGILPNSVARIERGERGASVPVRRLIKMLAESIGSPAPF